MIPRLLLKSSLIGILVVLGCLDFFSCAKVKPVITPWDKLILTPQEQQKLRVNDQDCGLHYEYPLSTGFEMWYLDVLCPDDRVLMIFFKIGQLYRGLTRKAEVALYAYEKGKPFCIKKLETNDFKAARESCSVRIGNNRLLGSYPNYTLALDIDGTRLDLRIHGLIQGYKLTDNKVVFGTGNNVWYNDWLIMLPRAYGEGVLEYQDQEIPIKGDIYFDHWMGNAPLNKTYAQCHWGKVFSERYTLIFLKAVAERAFGSRPLGFFMLFEDDQLLAATDKIRLTTRSSNYSAVTQQQYPTSMDILVDSAEVKGVVRCFESIVLAETNHVRNKLGSFAPLFYPLARLIWGTPYSYGLFSNVEAEFEVQGEVISFEGKMFHEIDNKRAR